jgi:threonine/homoserine/homoserine lactone efflux protein
VFSSSLAVVFGLSTITSATPTLFTGLQLFGILYLLYLAFREWRKVTEDTKIHVSTTGSRCFWQGFLVDTLNPGSLLFLVGFLPQFVNPALGHVKVQLLVLSLLYTLCDLSFNVVLAYISGQAGSRISPNPKFVILRRYGLITLYAGLAFYFVFQSH